MPPVGTRFATLAVACLLGAAGAMLLAQALPGDTTVVWKYLVLPLAAGTVILGAVGILTRDVERPRGLRAALLMAGLSLLTPVVVAWVLRHG